jgi:hypothetical protein
LAKPYFALKRNELSTKALDKEVLKQIARDEYGCNGGMVGITPEILQLI